VPHLPRFPTISPARCLTKQPRRPGGRGGVGGGVGIGGSGGSGGGGGATDGREGSPSARPPPPCLCLGARLAPYGHPPPLTPLQRAPAIAEHSGVCGRGCRPGRPPLPGQAAREWEHNAARPPPLGRWWCPPLIRRLPRARHARFSRATSRTGRPSSCSLRPACRGGRLDGGYSCWDAIRGALPQRRRPLFF